MVKLTARAPKTQGRKSNIIYAIIKVWSSLVSGQVYMHNSEEGLSACHVTSVSSRVLSLLLVIGNVGNPACIILSLTISSCIE